MPGTTAFLYRGIIERLLLKSIGVEEKLAEQDACKIEHVIRKESFDKLQTYLEQALDK